MKYALIDGIRFEAEPKRRGQCPLCNKPVISKCGVHKIWHWAHVSAKICDHWWEPETQWHREYKSEFPESWQEVRLRTGDGELHIADVKTENGFVLEFQHSNILPIERLTRERFYQRMVWVVNERRLKRDLPSFQAALDGASFVQAGHLKLQMAVQNSAILKRWVGATATVYVDFADVRFSNFPQIQKHELWQLKFYNKYFFVEATPLSRQSFIDHHLGKGKLLGFAPPILMMSPSDGAPLYGFERQLRKQEALRRCRIQKRVQRLR